MTSSIFKTLYILVLAISLVGCAESIIQTPTQLQPIVVTEQKPPRKLASSIELMPDTNYRRTLKAGSQWTHIGTISQGNVYKPYQDIFTLEGKHIHEAYLVINNDMLVGFYLPVERGFSSLSQKISLTFH